MDSKVKDKYKMAGNPLSITFKSTRDMALYDIFQERLDNLMKIIKYIIKTYHMYNFRKLDEK